MALSEDYLHESACSLWEEDHRVHDLFIDVLERVVLDAPISVDMGAAGCGSCFNIDQEEYSGAIYWVAQGDGYDKLAVKYDTVTDGFDATELGELITNVADTHDVQWSWSGSTMDSVILGVEGYYTTYDPGTRVETNDGETGTVLSQKLVHPLSMNYAVWDQEDFDGHGPGGDRIAMFAEKEDAERFERNHSRDDRQHLKVGRLHHQGSRDGDNIVLIDGQSRPMIVKGSKLTVIDD